MKEHQTLRIDGLLLGLAATAILAATGCGGGDAPESDDRARSKPVELEIVAPQSFISYARVPGVVEARSSMSLSFRVSGTIAAFAVDEGDRIEAGELIAELDPRDYQSDLDLARATLSSAESTAAEAQRELERQQRLLSSKSTSTQKLEGARSAHEVAAAEARRAKLSVQAAQAALDDCRLTAPVSGYIEQRFLDPHEVATAQSPVVVLTQLDSVKVMANVADRALPFIEIDGPATVRSSAWPGRVFEGRIARVAMAADPQTHTLPIEVELDNPDLALRPELVVEVAVPIGEALDVLTVPMNAVVRDGGRRTLCFVAADTNEGLVSEARPVVLGRLQGDRVTIEAGLRQGDRVVVRGHHFLDAGDAIHTPEPVAAVASSEDES